MLEACAWRSDGGVGRPLCIRYHVVALRTLIVELHQRNRGQALTLHWALGTSTDGRQEVLGVWPVAQVAQSAWPEICEHLVNRGVEQVDFINSDDADVIETASLESSALSVDKQSRRIAKATIAAPSPRKLRMVQLCRSRAASMDAELERSLCRHGPFDTTAAACAFVEAALERLERRFWTGVPARARRTHRRTQAAVRAAAS